MKWIFLINVLSSVAGALFVLLIQFLYKKYSESNSPFTGLWEDYIIDPNTNVVKKDHIFLKQCKNIVSGEIIRLAPHNHLHRKWKFSGRLIGNDIFAIFWPIDNCIPSYGCWYIHLVNDYTFEGFYLKIDENSGRQIQKIPITVKRVKKS